MSEHTPERILFVVAHPDDIDFGSAGSAATWVAAGIDVQYCLVTSGDAGGSDRTQSFDDRTQIREAEQRAAAAEVGVKSLHFLRQPDGRLEANLDLRMKITRVIRRVRPDRVITMSPVLNLDRIYGSHPDHLAVGQATLAAVYPDARNPFAHPELLDEGLEPWSVPEVWILAFEASATTQVVDITEQFERKVAALQSHTSQVAGREGLEEMLRDWGTRCAVAGGLGEGRLGELYRVVDTR